MKQIVVLTFVLMLAGSAASANSIGFNLEGADLVVAGTVTGDGQESDRYAFHRVAGIELIKGTLPEGAVRLVCPRNICYHVHVAANQPTLLFLKRMDAAAVGGERGGSVYIALASPMSAVPLEGDEGDLILETVRAQAAAGSDPVKRADAVALGLFAGLEPNRSTLLHSALVDAVRTPGAFDRLDALDRSRLLHRYRDTRPGTLLQQTLLDALGCVQPDGMTDELIRTVRGPAGGFHREQIAAILAATGDESTPRTLVDDFAGLGKASRSNVLHVLGSMGRGRGVAAIRSVMWCRKEGVLDQAIRSLILDRTQGAVDGLADVIRSGERTQALSAVAALASINTELSRKVLNDVRRDESLDMELRRNAALFLSSLTRKR